MTIHPHSTWIIWALMSAVFAALTAIFAKIGVANINSDLATFIRTVVILVVLASILAAILFVSRKLAAVRPHSVTPGRQPSSSFPE